MQVQWVNNRSISASPVSPFTVYPVVRLHTAFFTLANHPDLIISLCLFLIMVHTADIVCEHTLEAVSLITTLNPTSPQLFLHTHARTNAHAHTSTTNCHPTIYHPPAILQLTQPLVSSSQPIPHMLLLRSCVENHRSCFHTHKLLIQIHTLPHLDIMHY